MTEEDLNKDTLTEKEVEELKELAKPITTSIFYDGYIKGLQDFAKALNMTIARTGRNDLPTDLIANELIPAHIKCACEKRDEILKEVGNEECCLAADKVILN